MSAPVLMAIGALAVYAAKRAGAPAAPAEAAIAPPAGTSADAGGRILASTDLDGVVVTTASAAAAAEGKPRPPDVVTATSAVTHTTKGEAAPPRSLGSTDLPTVESPAELPSVGPKGAIGGSLPRVPTTPPDYKRTPYATARLIESVGPSLGMVW